MADKFLIRAYNVELGDCIYCRIPRARVGHAANEDFHMLIDCGSWGSFSALKSAVEHLKEDLPDAGHGKKRLDLLVVTHEHKDHIAGFDADLFADLTISSIWMSTAMNRDHPQSQRTVALQDYAKRAMRSLAELNLHQSPEIRDLMEIYSVSNDDALETLQKTLPEANGIQPQYVRAGDTAESLGIALRDTTIEVLGPEQDIDGYYLGEDPDSSLWGLEEMAMPFEPHPASGPRSIPTNISLADFRRLQSRMMSNALAFADEAGSVVNNTSVILLIEWKGKRLLFVGDAEWDARFKQGKKNASWNVMWHLHKDKLERPIDFLKIGHHGSVNATPWNDAEDGRETEPSAILDAILPVQRSHAAQAIASTLRKNYQSIPSAALLVEIGKRIGNSRTYEEVLTEGGVKLRDLPFFSMREKRWLGEKQPLRTDFEALLSDDGFVEVEISA
ncbi:MBL fold metallo-hydrolase [Bradyrhizobium tunisiense]|uniref:MBL fold metallo-hydrolase n=1 Tax=Bradyrhizobium tunisiense TaxID=3278709 RepID=UPI0035DDF0D0